jgi:uncharacterized membrane protein YhaH (DUF805 family)
VKEGNKMSETQSADRSHRKVDIVEAITLFFSNYVNFQGRSSRGAYWWVVVFSISVGFVAGFIDTLIGGDMASGSGPVSILVNLAFILPSISLAMRRLHDIDKSGWWLLIALTIIGILLLIYWYAQPGQNKENKFGPDVEAGRK